LEVEVARVLFAGESWSVTTIHTKGFDTMASSTYEEAGGHFIAALTAAGHEVQYQPSHVALHDFPSTAEELGAFDVVVLSDIGSNTMLLPPKTYLKSETTPNRLIAISDWVAQGGALAMVGGYMSFQGLEGKANYRATPLATVLPVELEIGDDRHEAPQGGKVKRSDIEHPITQGMDLEWPTLLGFQRLVPKPSAQVLATIDDWPLLVVGHHGEGRALAFASDMAPHWAPPEFLAWKGYGQMWASSIGWLAGEIR
jgi:uncharacterized membrane protein